MGKRGGGIVFEKDANKLGDGRDEDEAKPEGGDVRVGICGDKDRLRGVVVVIGGRPSEADAAESAFVIVFWRDEIEELDEGKLLKDTDSKDGEMLCDAEGGDGFGDRNGWAGVLSWDRRRGRGSTLGTLKGRRK